MCRLPPRLILLLMTVLLSSGCDRASPEAMLDNYRERVTYVLEESTAPDPPAAGAIPLFPPRRDRWRPQTDLRQGLFEVLALRHCNLLSLIAERNSSLGKVMRPSQQLVYEMRFLVRLRDCRQQLARAQDPDVELRLQVETIYDIKSRELPSVIWNAIYASSEMESNFSRGEPPLPLMSDQSIEASLASFTALSSLQTLITTPDWQLPAELGDIERHYQVLEANRFGSHWLKSVWLLTHTLEQTARALDKREQRFALCPQDRPTPKARILFNVFSKYYVGEVQPYMARVDQSGRRWKELHQQLLGSLPATDAMLDYQNRVFADDNPDSLWQRYIAARNHHTQSWQAILRRCNLMPGSTDAATN